MAVKTKTEADRRVLYPVLQNGHIGYINNAGKLVVAPQFSGPKSGSFRVLGAVTVRALREGLAPVDVLGVFPAGLLVMHGERNVLKPHPQIRRRKLLDFDAFLAQ